MPLLSLPTDVLREVFEYCNAVSSITETCRDFADVAHLTPSLWRNFYIGPRQFALDGPSFLRSRIGRSGTLPITVSISLPPSSGSLEKEVMIMNDIHRMLSEQNLRINRLEINAQTAIGAGRAFSAVYPSLMAPFPELKSLSVKVAEDQVFYTACWPRFDLVLQRALPFFPNLATIAIPTLYDVIPVFEAAQVFSRITTLIYDGYYWEEQNPKMAVIAGLLHHLPQLETLWVKTINRFIGANLSGPTIRKTKKNLFDVRIPISLNRLLHLAITVPGTGTDVLLCIDAPALRQVHLDGSRGHLFEDLFGPENPIWCRAESVRVQSSLKPLASRSPNLRHLALAATYLPEECWTWLLLGNAVEPPPFPCLESLALHELDAINGKVACGLTEACLLRYSMRSDISLKKLTFRRCTFPLDGAILIQMFDNFIQRRPSTSYTLEIDRSFKGVTEEHLERLRLGGVAIRDIDHEVPGWWTHAHEVDPLDSLAYE